LAGRDGFGGREEKKRTEEDSCSIILKRVIIPEFAECYIEDQG